MPAAEARRRKRRPARQWLFAAMTVALSLLVVLVVGEVAARLLFSGAEVGWTRAPSAAERAAQARAPDGAGVRLVALGDSFTVWGDEEGLSYPRVAARLVPGIDVVNLAEAGTGLCAYHDNLVSLVPGLAADWIVIGLYLGNDLAPCALAGRSAGAPAVPSRSAAQWLRDNSLLLTLLWRTCKSAFAFCRSGTVDRLLEERRAAQGWSEAELQARLAVVDPELLAAARADRINFVDLVQGVFAPDHYGRIAAAADEDILAAIADVAALARQARGLGARVVVVLLPPATWAGERYADYYRRLGYGDLGPTAGEVPAIARLQRALAAEDVVVLDVLPLLRAAEADLYLPLDTHLNGEGQRLVGEALAAVLAAQADR